MTVSCFKKKNVLLFTKKKGANHSVSSEDVFEITYVSGCVVG